MLVRSTAATVRPLPFVPDKALIRALHDAVAKHKTPFRFTWQGA